MPNQLHRRGVAAELQRPRRPVQPLHRPLQRLGAARISAGGVLDHGGLRSGLLRQANPGIPLLQPASLLPIHKGGQESGHHLPRAEVPGQ